jgi:endonuclease YncB( thermonuclease family)
MKNFIFLFLLFIINNAVSQNLAVVRAVHDGDSYGVRFLDRQDTTIFLRLHNVDSPEITFYSTKDQPYGRQAGNNMRNLLKGDTVEVTVVYKDFYNRLVCDIKLDTIDLTEYVIQTGNGWFSDDNYLSDSRRKYLKFLQKDAMKKKLGLWSLSGRKIRPDTWRKRYARIS